MYVEFLLLFVMLAIKQNEMMTKETERQAAKELRIFFSSFATASYLDSGLMIGLPS